MYIDCVALGVSLASDCYRIRALIFTMIVVLECR